jgi:hypothetical protein
VQFNIQVEYTTCTLASNHNRNPSFRYFFPRLRSKIGAKPSSILSCPLTNHACILQRAYLACRYTSIGSLDSQGVKIFFLQEGSCRGSTTLPASIGEIEPCTSHSRARRSETALRLTTIRGTGLAFTREYQGEYGCLRCHFSVCTTT